MRPAATNVYFLGVLLVLLLVASLLLAHSPRAAAMEVQDARCVPPSGVQPYYILYNKQYAESFSPRHSGKLTRGFIETFNALNQPATYSVEIWAADLSGLPTGSSPLASTTVNNPGYGYDFEYPSFSSLPKVTAGKNYALVVTVPDANNNGITVIPGNVCTGTFSLNQTGSGAFTPDPNNRDMEFSVFVTPPPRVTSLTATLLSLKTNFKATFSEEMDRSTLNRATFQLYKCASNTDTNCTTRITDVTVTSSSDGRSATLNPYGTSSTLLAKNTKYKVIVTTGAKDLVGNRLDQNPSQPGNQPKVAYFRTGST